MAEPSSRGLSLSLQDSDNYDDYDHTDDNHYYDAYDDSKRSSDLDLDYCSSVMDPLGHPPIHLTWALVTPPFLGLRSFKIQDCNAQQSIQLGEDLDLLWPVTRPEVCMTHAYPYPPLFLL